MTQRQDTLGKLSRNTGNLDLPLADFVIIDDHVEWENIVMIRGKIT